MSKGLLLWPSCSWGISFTSEVNDIREFFDVQVLFTPAVNEVCSAQAIPVKIFFRSNELRRDCNTLSLAQRRWGSAATLVRRRLDDLDAVATLRQFVSLPHIKARMTTNFIRVELDRVLEMILTSHGRRDDANPLLDSRVVVVNGIEENHGG